MSVIDSVPLVLGGLLAGFVFGFLLQKGQVANYRVIVGQFLMVDHTVLKIMLTAIVVGSIGVYGMLALGWIDGLLIKPAVLAANLVGGLVFGVGMVGVGYCPGTGIAAVGAGSKHAVAAVLGMLVGAALYTEAYPAISRLLAGTPDLGKVSLADLTGLSPWAFIGALAAIALGVFALVERQDPSFRHAPR